MAGSCETAAGSQASPPETLLDPSPSAVAVQTDDQLARGKLPELYRVRMMMQDNLAIRKKGDEDLALEARKTGTLSQWLRPKLRYAR